VVSFSEALWEDAQGTGVKVSCLCPGPTVSGFRARAANGKTRLADAGEPMPSMDVARQGYDAWERNQRVIVTGTRNAIAAWLVPMLPRTQVLKLVRRIQSPR
jgi:short-subunit dehydrogenase